MITINIMAIGAFILKAMATIFIVSFVMAAIFGLLGEFISNDIICNIRDVSLGVCGMTFLAGLCLLGVGVAIAMILEMWV